MLNPILSVVALVLVTALVGALLGSVWFGIIPGLIAGAALYWYISTRVNKLLQVKIAEVQAILTPKNQNPMKPQKPRIDDAVKVLREARAYGRWQPFIARSMDEQIGMLYFMVERYDEARPFLATASPRNWMASAMRAVMLYKQKKTAEMKAVFEETVKHSKKESLLWNIYAWCLLESGDRTGAVSVLARALEHVATDERTQRNRDRVSNGKDMRMTGWAEMWYQFRLETPPMQAAMPQPRFSRRGRR
jgi:hypothetical protein